MNSVFYFMQTIHLKRQMEMVCKGLHSKNLRYERVYLTPTCTPLLCLLVFGTPSASFVTHGIKCSALFYLLKAFTVHSLYTISALDSPKKYIFYQTSDID